MISCYTYWLRKWACIQMHLLMRTKQDSHSPQHSRYVPRSASCKSNIIILAFNYGILHPVNMFHQNQFAVVYCSKSAAILLGWWRNHWPSTKWLHPLVRSQLGTKKCPVLPFSWQFRLIAYHSFRRNSWYITFILQSFQHYIIPAYIWFYSSFRLYFIQQADVVMHGLFCWFIHNM